MADDAHIRKMTCPSCGAPVDLNGTSGTCDYCGARLERSQPAPKPTPATGPTPIPAVQVQVVQWPVASHGIQVVSAEDDEPTGCVGGFLALPFIVLGIAAVLLGGWFYGDQAVAAISGLATSVPGMPSIDIPSVDIPSVEIAATADRSHSWSVTNGPAVLLPATGAAAKSDMIVTAYNPFENRYALLYLAGGETQERWASESLDISYGSPVFLGSNTLYAVSETDLVAINLADGTTVWRAALVDAVHSHTCQDCLQVIAGNVIALTQDGTLQAFDAASGRPLWSTQLNQQPRQLLAVNGYAAVFDQENQDAEVDVVLYDPADGTEAQRLSPRCPNEPFPGRPQGPNIFAPAYPADGGKTLYIVAGFFEPGCLQRWDATTGTMVWQATFPIDLLRSDEDDLMTETTYYLSSGHGLTAVNLADGAVRQLMDEPDYALTPLGEQAGLLLVGARRERGTQRDELWAVDANSGERRWQFVPQATERVGGLSTTFRADAGLWTWQFTNQGIFVLQAHADPGRLVVETLQFQDGVSSGQTTIPVTELSHTFELVGRQGNVLWLRVDSGLVALDTTSSALTSQWP